MKPDAQPTTEAATSHSVLVNPHERREGFWANIRGHVFDLADPSSGSALAPTPDDIFIVSIAAALAWRAQTALRSCELPDYVSVAATWRAPDEDARALSDISLTVTVSQGAEGAKEPLAALLEESLTSRFLAEPSVRVSLEEESR